MSFQKKVLVTGSAGFIGYHLALALKKRGDFCLGLDNFNSYYSVDLKRKRASLLKEKKIETVEIDLASHPNLEKIFEEHKITHVVHLAAQAGVRYAQKNPTAYLKSNIDGFCNLLEALRKKPEIRLIYASSSSVYGCNQKIPFSESDGCDAPANLYAATKKANELMAHSYHHLYGMEATGLRFFTVYGPWGRPDMAYFAFCDSILAGKEIELFNNGLMQRDFTYIDDIISGILAAIDVGGTTIYNLGNNQPVRLLDFIEILEELLGKRAKKVFLGASKGEVAVTYADITKAKRELNFAPKTSIREGLSHFVNWYKTYTNNSL